MSVNVYLTAAHPSTPVLCIRGIRAALSVLGGGGRAPITHAAAIWGDFSRSKRPTLIGYAPDVERAQEAAQAAVEASNEGLVVGYGLSEEEIEGGEVRPSEPTIGPSPMGPLTPFTPADVPGADFQPSLAAVRVALNMLAQNDGNPTAALVWSRMLDANGAGSPVLTEAVSVILASFPVITTDA